MTGFRGVSLSIPIPRPSFTLTDQREQPFDFLRETEGKVALLFFGYTHCPDVCPVHLANIAAVLQRMPQEERNAIRVVFVTTDPKRDTPARIAEWLGAIDPTFVGLTGDTAEIARVQRALGIAPAYQDGFVGDDSSNYAVGHAAQVFAFARDGRAYLEYPAGIRQEDWAHDLPKLARDATGEVTRRESANGAQGAVAITPDVPVTMAGLTVPVAVIARPLTQSEASLYFVVRNGTPEADELVAAGADVAGATTLHDSFSAGRMAPIASATVPAGGELRFEPGAQHAMLMGLTRKLATGDTVMVKLRFRRLGGVEVAAAVVPYEEVQGRLAGAK
jgi:cytochrome oxidase Cu insertion factor (SCO1/SenC/PrrC family)/copper(I)-binding protein